MPACRSSFGLWAQRTLDPARPVQDQSSLPRQPQRVLRHRAGGQTLPPPLAASALPRACTARRQLTGAPARAGTPRLAGGELSLRDRLERFATLASGSRSAAQASCDRTRWQGPGRQVTVQRDDFLELPNGLQRSSALRTPCASRHAAVDASNAWYGRPSQSFDARSSTSQVRRHLADSRRTGLGPI
jgi:hypothetical protein